MKFSDFLHEKTGFTLVEMMVAIGIIGLIALGLVKFSSNFEKGYKHDRQPKTFLSNLTRGYFSLLSGISSSSKALLLPEIFSRWQ